MLGVHMESTDTGCSVVQGERLSSAARFSRLQLLWFFLSVDLFFVPLFTYQEITTSIIIVITVLHKERPSCFLKRPSSPIHKKARKLFLTSAVGA